MFIIRGNRKGSCGVSMVEAWSSMRCSTRLGFICIYKLHFSAECQKITYLKLNLAGGSIKSAIRWEPNYLTVAFQISLKSNQEWMVYLCIREPRLRAVLNRLQILRIMHDLSKYCRFLLVY